MNSEIIKNDRREAPEEDRHPARDTTLTLPRESVYSGGQGPRSRSGVARRERNFERRIGGGRDRREDIRRAYEKMRRSDRQDRTGDDRLARVSGNKTTIQDTGAGRRRPSSGQKGYGGETRGGPWNRREKAHGGNTPHAREARKKSDDFRRTAMAMKTDRSEWRHDTSARRNDPKRSDASEP